MKGRFQSTNKQLAEIYKQLKDVYQKLSKDDGIITHYSHKNHLWEQLFPGVLLMKNLELMQEQMNDLLNLTYSLKENTNNEDQKPHDQISKDIREDPSDTPKEIVVKNDKFINTEKHSGSLNLIESTKHIGVDIPSVLALDIINLRDQIFIAKFNCDETQQKLLKSLYEELGRILQVNGIESLEQEKLFNSQCHTIVDVRITDNQALNNMIADVYRPGYRINGKVMRAQEVVLYKYEEPK